MDRTEYLKLSPCSQKKLIAANISIKFLLLLTPAVGIGTNELGVTLIDMCKILVWLQHNNMCNQRILQIEKSSSSIAVWGTTFVCSNVGLPQVTPEISPFKVSWCQVILKFQRWAVIRTVYPAYLLLNFEIAMILQNSPSTYQ